MLNIRRCILAPALSAALASSLALPLTASAQEKRPGIKVVDPDKKVPKASAAALDTEHFEVGFNIGIMSVEDFNSNPSVGAALRYYFNEKFLIEGAFGRSQTKRSSTEETDNRDFIADRYFQYIGISAGYQFLKGRSFLGKRRKYNTGLYILGGIEQVDFAEDSNTGLLVALSYKTVVTDWLTMNIDFRNHIVQRELFGDDKLTQNTEIVFGFSSLF